MIMVIDGQPVNVLDDEELMRFAVRRAAIVVSGMSKATRNAELESRIGGATYVAAKFGALCAALKANPAMPVEAADLYALADLMGEVAGLNLGLSTAEVQRVEADDLEGTAGGGAGEEASGDGGGAGGGGHEPDRAAS
jgi:hypothetical protein